MLSLSEYRNDYRLTMNYQGVSRGISVNVNTILIYPSVFAEGVLDIVSVGIVPQTTHENLTKHKYFHNVKLLTKLWCIFLVCH